jgi:hypothetical protein
VKNSQKFLILSGLIPRLSNKGVIPYVPEGIPSEDKGSPIVNMDRRYHAEAWYDYLLVKNALLNTLFGQPQKDKSPPSPMGIPRGRRGTLQNKLVLSKKL